MAITIRFEQERDTKNTVRFAEVPAPGAATAVGTLYVQKWQVIALGNPQAITVTISAADGSTIQPSAVPTVGREALQQAVKSVLGG